MAAAPSFEALWQEYRDSDQVYFVSAYKWQGHTHNYSQQIIPFAQDYMLNYTPYFAIVGAENIFKHASHSPDMEGVLNKAILSFEDVGLYVSSPLEDITVNYSTAVTFDLDTVFTAVSGNEVTFEIMDRKATHIAEADIDGNTLTVTAAETYGQVSFTVKATEGEFTSYNRFSVSVDNSALLELLSESFEDLQFPSEGWSDIQVTGEQGRWFRSKGGRIPDSSYPLDGDFIACFNSYDDNCLQGNNNRLELPAQDLSDYRNTKLRFKFQHNYHILYEGNDTLQVQIKHSDGEWRDFGNKILRFEGDSTYYWQEYSFDLREFDGSENMQLGLCAKSAGGSDIMVDDIRLLAEPLDNGIAETAAKNVAAVITLKGNYPNPFNPTTSIIFEMSHNAEIYLKVYNIKGELVSAPLTKRVTPGRQSLTFDGSGLDSGIYYYTLRTAQSSLTGKMVLVK